ncbi:MAG: envelope stress response membrane protein PspB [Pseudomonadota bacterium]
MPDEVFVLILVLLVAVPWMVLHYMTKWKQSATITTDDEVLLEELYNLAKRLDERMDTVERLVAEDDPSFSPVKRIQADLESDNQQLRELDRLIAEKKGAKQ